MIIVGAGLLIFLLQHMWYSEHVKCFPITRAHQAIIPSPTNKFTTEALLKFTTNQEEVSGLGKKKPDDGYTDIRIYFQNLKWLVDKYKYALPNSLII